MPLPVESNQGSLFSLRNGKQSAFCFIFCFAAAAVAAAAQFVSVIISHAVAAARLIAVIIFASHCRCLQAGCCVFVVLLWSQLPLLLNFGAIIILKAVAAARFVASIIAYSDFAIFGLLFGKYFASLLISIISRLRSRQLHLLLLSFLTLLPLLD